MLEVKNISKSFGEIEAVKNISFSLAPGQFYGLLGPNGAGKSTTINMISTVIVPDDGDISINGHDIKTNPLQCKRSIGIVPQEIALYGMLSAYENLYFWGGLYDIPPKELKENIEQTLDLLGLKDRKDHKIDTYSGGMKRRINIAAALLHRPKILLMDEPTVGIDPQSRNLIFEVLQQLHKEGMTIIYTTHYMEEAQRLCEKIGIIDHGRIIAQGNLTELRNLAKTKETIQVVTDGLDDKQCTAIQEHWGKKVKISEQQLVFDADQADQELSQCINDLAQLAIPIKNIAVQPVNLETVFMQLTGRQLRD